MRELKIVQCGNFPRKVLDPVAMKFNHLPRACPDTLAAICAAFFNHRYLRFLKFNRIFGTYADTAAAIIALARTDVDH